MESRTDKSLKNIYISLGMYAFQLIFSVINRTVFIKLLGSEYLGISGLFSNILAFLVLAESGIGNAMAYALYRPLKDKNVTKIKSIMKLYDKLYWIVGFLVLIIGTSITPFLHFLIKDMPSDMPLISIYYLMYVFNSGISYFFSYRRTILICDQKLYISNIIRTVSFTLLAILQAAILFITHSFFWYLLMMIIMTITENLIVSYIATKKYPYLKDKNVEKLDESTKNEIKKNVGAIFVQKVGNAFIDSTDNIILSKCVGIVIVGIYSNYVMIINVATRIMDSVFSSLSASVGNLLAEDQNNHSKDVFDRIMFICVVMHGFLAICMFCVLNSLMQNWLGEEYKIGILVVSVICLNFYLRGIRRPINLFKEAAGIFWNDRYRTIIEAVINICVSIPLTLKYGILGTLLGTTISMMTFSFWYEAYLVYKHVFTCRFSNYIRIQSKYIAFTFIIGIIAYWVTNFIPYYNWYLFFIRALICGLIVIVMYVLIYYKNKNAQFIIGFFQKKIYRRKK